MENIEDNQDLQNLEDDTGGATQSLAQLWAKKYIRNLKPDEEPIDLQQDDWLDIVAQERRHQISAKLHQSLRFASARAWSKTETLLASEIYRHHIDPHLLDPWQIAADSRYLFERLLEVFVELAPTDQSSAWLEQLGKKTLAKVKNPERLNDLSSPGRLSVIIAPEVDKVRHKYTAQDPRVLGFVSMQFHYSGQLLLDLLSPLEKIVLESYFKVIDDHLYMPLHRAYEAAAQHSYDADELVAVRSLLPLSSDIAKSVCQRVIWTYRNYRSYSGNLNTPCVKTSSIRDVEMFQVYLCLCVLEGNISALQQELFPLCVMLYPPLKVSWDLIRDMLTLLGQEIINYMDTKNASIFQSYLEDMSQMFAVEVLEGI